MKTTGFRDAEIQVVPISKIKPAAFNPRVELKPGDEAYEALKASMQEFGFVEPLVWNKRSGNLVGGHQRFSVLKDMGKKDAQVVVVDLDKKRERALNLALNKITGSWDYEKLAVLLKELSGDAGLSRLTGYSEGEIEELLRMSDPGPQGGGGVAGADNEIKQIILLFRVEEYRSVLARLQAIMEETGARDHTEAVLRILDAHEKS